jgi:beta-lactamase regulating signal transducer with metallopeptidase domain
MIVFAQIAIGVWLQSGALLLLGLLVLWATRRYGPGVQTLIGRWVLTGVVAVAIISPSSNLLPPSWTLSLPSMSSETIIDAPPQTTEIAIPTHSIRLALDSAGESAPVSVSDQKPPTPYTLSLMEIFLTTAAWLWIAGSSLLLTWMAICQIALLRLRHTAQKLSDGPVYETLAALTRWSPRLYVHGSVASPFLAGILRPSIFLPSDFAQHSEPSEQRAVLAHELAHLERRDCAWNFAARLVCMLLWTQPLLWALCRQLEHISEEACDIAVVERDCPPREYANFLLTLAERRQASRIQRAIGVGVIPFRSAVGRRIQRILTATLAPARDLTRRLRSGVTIGTLAASGFSVLLLGAGVDSPHFDWAKQQGWTVRPVRVVSLNHGSLIAGALPDYEIPEGEKALVVSLGVDQDHMEIASAPPSEEVKTTLENFLAKRPHSFYAEYLLGTWYNHHGDFRRGSELVSQALHDAPAVLAGRVEYDDGSPVAGWRFYTSIGCCGMKPSHPQKGVRLDYPYVITDSDGCYYLPVYRALYAPSSVILTYDDVNKQITAPRFHGDGVWRETTDTAAGEETKQHKFELIKGSVSESRVGVLPVINVRPKISLRAPFREMTGSQGHPMTISSPQLVVSWDPIPHAAQYHVQIGEYAHNQTTFRVLHLPDGSYSMFRTVSENHIALDFAGTTQIFNRNSEYTMTIEAFDRRGKSLSISPDIHFRPTAALAPQPPTVSAFAQAWGPHFQVISVQQHGDRVNVKGKRLSSWNASEESALTDGRRFGWEDGTINWSSSTVTGQPVEITYHTKRRLTP